MYSDEINLYMEEYIDSMKKAVEHYQNEILQIRAGRANPRILDRVLIDYYGTLTPLSQMSTISVPEARMIIISLWDISMLKAVLKAIENANLGVSPSDDGRVIRLVFPQLTEERRKEFIKDVRKLSENVKVVCRNCRRDILDEFKRMKKENTLNEDDYNTLDKTVQKNLDEIIAQINTIQEKKEKDLMEV